jgi:hypothetical protein
MNLALLDYYAESSGRRVITQKSEVLSYFVAEAWNHAQAWTGSEGSRRLRLPEFIENRHTEVVRLSTLRNGRLYPQEIPLELISIKGWVDSRGQNTTERMKSIKIPLEIEPVTFRLVAQCLNQLCTAYANI